MIPVPSWIRRTLLAVLFGILAGRIALTWRVFNDTTDESGHIVAGLEMLERGSYTIEAQHPPVGRLVVGALPYLVAGLRLGGSQRLWYGGPWSQADPALYWKSLALARAGNLLFAAVLFVVVYAWSRRLYGESAALLGCLMVACCPNGIAHAALATIDAGAAATVLLAAYCLWRWSCEPGWRWRLAAAGALSLAVLTKFSAIPFLVPIGGMYWLLARGNRWRMLAGLPVLAVVFLGAVWTAYLFPAGRMVPYMFSRGLAELWEHNQAGHVSYLLGSSSASGWWYYFPVALAVKTPLPLLALAALGAATQRRKREMLYPALAAAVILGVAMTARLNIGIRHVLAIYPLLAVLAAGAWTSGARVRVVVLALAGWHAAESALAHPHYLAYFNPIARGREEHFLVDSNLDWGQDLALLGRWMRENGVNEVQLRYSGVTEPEKVGVKARPLPDPHPDPGWAAISVNHLAGPWRAEHNYEWYQGRRPEARVGKSIWVWRRGTDASR